MRVTLTQPALARHDATELTPPLGLLMLAAALEHDSFDVEIIDLNLAGLEDPTWNGMDAISFAVQAIAATAPDVVGLTSMALEAHICLEVARRLKDLDPQVRVVLGGAQFSATADAILEIFPWIDFIVLGEGERTFTELCRTMRQGKSPGRMPNLAHHACLAKDTERLFKPLASLEELPDPAYHLVDLERYFRVNPLRRVSIEHARGCALRCEYCYSPVHWGQGEQRRTVDRVQREMQRLHAAGARHFFFVSDNFLNSKRAAMTLTAAIAELGLDFTWNGYATLAQLDSEIAAGLAASGCRAMFVGIDAITSQHQQRFKKHYFRGRDDLTRRLGACVEHGIVPTCAFLVEPPYGDTSNIDETLEVATFTRTLGCNVTLNPLTVYSGTGVSQQVRRLAYSDAKPKLLFDTYDFNQNNDLAKSWPELFPCHNTLHGDAVEQAFCATVYCAHALIKTYPRTLIRYALDAGGSLWGLAQEVSDLCGRLTDVPPRERRDMVRETFQAHAREHPPLAGVRPYVEYERCERELVTMRPKTVTLHDHQGGGRQTRTITPYAQFSLPISPVEMFTHAALSRSDAGPGAEPYLIVAQRDRVDYFAISDELARRLPPFERLQEQLECGSSPGGRADTEADLSVILAQFGIIESGSTTSEEEAR